MPVSHNYYKHLITLFEQSFIMLHLIAILLFIYFWNSVIMVYLEVPSIKLYFTYLVFRVHQYSTIFSQIDHFGCWAGTFIVQVMHTFTQKAICQSSNLIRGKK